MAYNEIAFHIWIWLFIFSDSMKCSVTYTTKQKTDVFVCYYKCVFVLWLVYLSQKVTFPVFLKHKTCGLMMLRSMISKYVEEGISWGYDCWGFRVLRILILLIWWTWRLLGLSKVFELQCTCVLHFGKPKIQI